MSFALPTFNLLGRIWINAAGVTWTVPPLFAPDYDDVPINLCIGLRVSTGVANQSILLPKGYTIWDSQATQFGIGPSWLEAPKGSGRFYMFILARNSAPGFLNEHIVGEIADLTPNPTE